MNERMKGATNNFKTNGRQARLSTAAAAAVMVVVMKDEEEEVGDGSDLCAASRRGRKILNGVFFQVCEEAKGHPKKRRCNPLDQCNLLQTDSLKTTLEAAKKK